MTWGSNELSCTTSPSRFYNLRTIVGVLTYRLKLPLGATAEEAVAQACERLGIDCRAELLLSNRARLCYDTLYSTAPTKKLCQHQESHEEPNPQKVPLQEEEQELHKEPERHGELELPPEPKLAQLANGHVSHFVISAVGSDGYPNRFQLCVRSSRERESVKLTCTQQRTPREERDGALNTDSTNESHSSGYSTRSTPGRMSSRLDACKLHTGMPVNFRVSQHHEI